MAGLGFLAIGRISDTSNHPQEKMTIVLQTMSSAPLASAANQLLATTRSGHTVFASSSSSQSNASAPSFSSKLTKL